MAAVVDVREVSIETAVEISKSVKEFAKVYSKQIYEKRYKDREKLILAGYIDNQPAGYAVCFDRDQDGSFYCWMAGVKPQYRCMGVLKSLIAYQQEWAAKHGYSKLKIRTRNNRREMLAYLVKYGFLFTEVIPVEDIKDNRICLEKPLSSDQKLS